jgi:predicted extracellular nuclease
MRFLLVAFLTLACSVSTLRADLVISEVYSAGSSNTTYGVDWFELTNRSSASIDITGWVMDDSSANFGSAVPFGPELTIIGAGQSVVFLETSSANFANRVALFNQAWFGSDTSSVAFGSYNGSGVGLSSSADAVNIYDGLGQLQASVSFGAATAGFTFDNAAGLTGAISQLSQIGVNGAFQSFNGAEVGSPGLIAAVPEPTSVALACVGLSGLALLRRRNRKNLQAPTLQL